MSKTADRSHAYKSVFKTQDGQIVIKDLMKFCHFDSPTFVPNDPYSSAYNEGMRRVILRILKITNTDVAAMEQLINEMNDYNRGM